jgi:hypothetical protein
MYYGIDILDISRRKVSLRKACVLIGNLPPESATMTAIRLDAPEKEDSDDTAEPADPDRFRWSSEEMLVAQLIDEIRMLRYVFTVANSGKGAAKVPPPDQVKRPGVKKESPRKLLSRQQVISLDPRLRRDERSSDA